MSTQVPQSRRLLVLAAAVGLALLAVAAFYVLGRPVSDPAPTPAAAAPSATRPATAPTAAPTLSVPASGDDWPTYMYDGARTGFNRGETLLSPDNAPNLKLAWKAKLGDVIAAQPVVKGDTVYVGAWDGFMYALSRADGSVKWKTDLGKTTAKICVPQTAGITSAAAIDGDTLYAGGGDNYLYALDPASGAIKWKFQTGDNSDTGGSYNWDSPLVYNGRVYYGNSAFCDRPFTFGTLWGVNAATGQKEQEVHLVTEGQRGGGIWTSPAVDEATGEFYVTVGSGDYYVPYNYSIARLDPKTLRVLDWWQIPIDEQVHDGDWGTTPTLFSGAGGELMVGAAAKNGNYYAFNAHNIAAGPVWARRIADGGECPQCGEGAISSSAYAYNTVYVAAGYSSLGEVQKFAGTVHALDPSTGLIKWIHPTWGSVVPALAVANGLVAVAGDDTLELLNAATGELVWEYATPAQIYAAPTIAGGMLYVASTDGYLYAFSAGPYDGKSSAYETGSVGGYPPNFTPYRKPVPAVPLQGEEQCFGDTGNCARGDILKFWRDNGGLDRFGPAVTGVLNEAGRTVQYFRNAALEIAPKAGGEGSEVRLAKFDFHLAYYTPEEEHFAPAAESPGATYVPETHHNLSEPFLTFWKTHGEVAGLGYPVSEPYDEYNVVDGETRHVQYFERSRLEIVVTGADGKEQVALGALGLQRYKMRYGALPPGR